MNENKRKIVINKRPVIIATIVAVLAIVTTIGLTYASFVPTIIQGQGTNITVASGRMDIAHASSKNIDIRGAIPRDQAQDTKTFTVTGVTTVNQTMTYHINLVVTSNSFPSDALSVTLTGVNNTGNGTIAQPLTPHRGIPTGSGRYLLGTGQFNYRADREDSVHTYTLSMFYLSRGVNQNDELGSTFSGYIELSSASGSTLNVLAQPVTVTFQEQIEQNQSTNIIATNTVSTGTTYTFNPSTGVFTLTGTVANRELRNSVNRYTCNSSNTTCTTLYRVRTTATEFTTNGGPVAANSNCRTGTHTFYTTRTFNATTGVHTLTGATTIGAGRFFCQNGGSSCSQVFTATGGTCTGGSVASEMLMAIPPRVSLIDIHTSTQVN